MPPVSAPAQRAPTSQCHVAPPTHHPTALLLPCALQELRAAGRDPYAYGFPRTHTAAQLQQLYTELPDGEVAEGATVAVAGRVMSRRFMGKLAFFKLVDASGSIQVRARPGIRAGCCAAVGSCMGKLAVLGDASGI